MKQRKGVEFLDGTVERRHDDGTYDVTFKVMTPKKLESEQEVAERKKEQKLKAKHVRHYDVT